MSRVGTNFWLKIGNFFLENLFQIDKVVKFHENPCWSFFSCQPYSWAMRVRFISLWKIAIWCDQIERTIRRDSSAEKNGRKRSYLSYTRLNESVPFILKSTVTLSIVDRFLLNFVKSAVMKVAQKWSIIQTRQVLILWMKMSSMIAFDNSKP